MGRTAIKPGTESTCTGTRAINAKPGDTVVISHEWYHSYSYSIMKEILSRRNITVVFEYNYMGEHYVVTIQKGKNFYLDEKILWLEPLKLQAMFGAVKTLIKNSITRIKALICDRISAFSYK